MSIAHCVICCCMVRRHCTPWGLEKCKFTQMLEDVVKGLSGHKGLTVKSPDHSSNGQSVSSHMVNFTEDDSKGPGIGSPNQLAQLTSTMQCMARPIQAPGQPDSVQSTTSRCTVTGSSYHLPGLHGGGQVSKRVLSIQSFSCLSLLQRNMHQFSIWPVLFDPVPLCTCMPQLQGRPPSCLVWHCRPNPSQHE